MDSIAEKINKLIDPLNQAGNEWTAKEIEEQLLSLLEAVAKEQREQTHSARTFGGILIEEKDILVTNTLKELL